MLPQVVTKVLTAADDDNICLSQTPSGAGNLIIAGAAASGGVASLDTQRVVLITTASDEGGKTLTVYGTNQSGDAVQQTITGPNATTGSTTINFKTVTRVAVSAAFTGAVRVGTSGVGASEWVMANFNITPFSYAWSAVLGGTANVTVQYTLDNVNTIASGTAPTVWPVATSAPTSLSGASSSATGSISTPFYAWRLLINSGTASVTVTGIQAGIV